MVQRLRRPVHVQRHVVRADDRPGHEPLAEFLLVLRTSDHGQTEGPVRRNQPRTAALRLPEVGFRIRPGGQYRLGHGERRRDGMADPQQRHRIVQPRPAAGRDPLSDASGDVRTRTDADAGVHEGVRLRRVGRRSLPPEPGDRTVRSLHVRRRRQLRDPRRGGVQRVGIHPHAHGRTLRMRRQRPDRAIFPAAARIREIGRRQGTLPRFAGHHLGSDTIGAAVAGSAHRQHATATFRPPLSLLPAQQFGVVDLPRSRRRGMGRHIRRQTGLHDLR